MSTVRAKFRVMSVTTHHHGQRDVRLSPVMKFTPDGKVSEENATFWEATPSGEIELRISPGRAAAEAFVPGAAFYVDFTPADG